MFSSRGTVRYEERGQGYRDVEKVGKHWIAGWTGGKSLPHLGTGSFSGVKCGRGVLLTTHPF